MNKSFALASLKKQVADSGLSRRAFLQEATALGVSLRSSRAGNGRPA